MNLRLPGVPPSLLLFILLFLPWLTARGQSGPEGNADVRRTAPALLLGPTVMIGYHSHTGNSEAGGGPVCAPVGNGAEWGPGVGLSAEWLPGSGNWSLLSRLTFEERPGGEFREVFLQPLPPSDPNLPFRTVSWSETAYRLLNAEFLLKRQVVDFRAVRIGLAAGPAVQYVLEGHMRRGYETDSGAGICFDEDIPGLNRFRCSLKGGIQGEIPLSGNHWMVSPGIFYDYALTDLAAVESRQVNSLIFQIDVRAKIW